MESSDRIRPDDGVNPRKIVRSRQLLHGESVILVAFATAPVLLMWLKGVKDVSHHNVDQENNLDDAPRGSLNPYEEISDDVEENSADSTHVFLVSICLVFVILFVSIWLIVRFLVDFNNQSPGDDDFGFEIHKKQRGGRKIKADT